MSNTKIHPWPTRKNPDSGRYEVQIAGVWRSRQYAWQLLRRMENRCKLCGRAAMKMDYPFCRKHSRAHAIASCGKWTGSRKRGGKGRTSETAESYTKYLPQSNRNPTPK